MTFRESARSEKFTIAAELTLKRETTADDVRRQVGLLGPWVDAIQVSDNPFAWVQMSSLSACAILLEQGVDPVPIMTCRDRNRRALAGDLAGLMALGVSSVMLIRGHRVPPHHSVKASTVFDLTGRELIELAAGIKGANDEPAFYIGTGARVFRPNRGWRGESLASRADSGASFVQTQMCFNVEMLRHYMRRLRASGLAERYAVMVSLSPLPSAETAKWVKENMGDSRIPADLVQRLADAEDPAREGILICAERMREVARIRGVSGVCLMTTGDPEAIPEAIRESGLRD
jgi:methylenetetrahydrofolate reductase (NADPH)